MKTVDLEKLEWPILVETLAAFSQTDDGKTLCLKLLPELDRDEIERRWSDVTSIRDIIRQGYKPPIGDLPPMRRIFKALSLGQILGGIELRQVLQLLLAVQKVHGFCVSFGTKSQTLARLKNQIYPTPKLMSAIDKAIGPDGQLQDDASPELASIRRKKVTLARRIEDQIKKVLREASFEQYLQDDFFTVRNERYVVPIRLDGRGRVPGTIVDTSESGQTLFFEPSSVAPLNAEWLENQLAEKLEILKIFKSLSQQTATELDTLRTDYDEMIQLDFLSAQAGLANQLDASAINICNEPVLDLKLARHPLIRKPAEPLNQLSTDSEEGTNAHPKAGAVVDEGLDTGDSRNQIVSLTRMKNTAVANDINLSDGQRCLIISGPNAGGKTIVLKTVGILHMMAKAGLLIPASPESRMYLFDNIYLEMGDAQNLSASLSTFSGHVLGLKPILESAGPQDLALLDELAVGTEPQTGSALAQAVLESLAVRGTFILATTHYDSLKGLAGVPGDASSAANAFRNGSMEYSLKTMRPTYKLILDVPGQSYGLEVASQTGLLPSVIERAKSLRGTGASSLENAINQLMAARQEVDQIKSRLRQSELAAEESQARLDHERKALEETRREIARKGAKQNEDELDEMRENVRELQEQLKAALKELRKSGSGNLQDAMDQAAAMATKSSDQLKELDRKAREVAARSREGETLPGVAVKSTDSLVAGQKVYVIPIHKDGIVLKPADSESGPAEIQVGLVKLRVPQHDLRLLTDQSRPSAQDPATTGNKGVQNRGGPKGAAARKQGRTGVSPLNPPPEIPGLVLQTPTNTVDVRGLDADTATSRTLDFIDKALLRGEGAIVVVHGHGTDKLKNTIRRYLRGNCPYNIAFRVGELQEGGDGVTVVALKG